MERVCGQRRTLRPRNGWRPSRDILPRRSTLLESRSASQTSSPMCMFWFARRMPCSRPHRESSRRCCCGHGRRLNQSRGRHSGPRHSRTRVKGEGRLLREQPHQMLKSVEARRVPRPRKGKCDPCITPCCRTTLNAADSYVRAKDRPDKSPSGSVPSLIGARGHRSAHSLHSDRQRRIRNQPVARTEGRRLDRSLKKAAHRPGHRLKPSRHLHVA